MSEEIVELHVIFRGRVQGVSFRWTVAERAEALSLTGSVRNLPDGTVEAMVQGPKSQLLLFLKAVKKDPGFAHIDSTSTKFKKEAHFFEGFQIVV